MVCLYVCIWGGGYDLKSDVTPSIAISSFIFMKIRGGGGGGV